MKTTVDIPDSLMLEVLELASREGTTIKGIVEEALRKILADRKNPSPFRLRKASFKGNGLQPGTKGASWKRIEEMAYEGRGG
ncbi:DUF2191 domain-containing protein [Thermodesulfobacteriota bacterium]